MGHQEKHTYMWSIVQFMYVAKNDEWCVWDMCVRMVIMDPTPSPCCSLATVPVPLSNRIGHKRTRNKNSNPPSHSKIPHFLSRDTDTATQKRPKGVQGSRVKGAQ